MSSQLSISLHGVKGTHWRSIVNCLFVSMVSLIYQLLVSSQLSICLHGVKGTHWRSIVNCLFVSMVSRVLIGGLLSICLPGLNDVPIVSVLSIVY